MIVAVNCKWHAVGKKIAGVGKMSSSRQRLQGKFTMQCSFVKCVTKQGL